MQSFCIAAKNSLIKGKIFILPFIYTFSKPPKAFKCYLLGLLSDNIFKNTSEQ